VAYPVVMAQQGTIRLTQIAAYDIYGDPAPCHFHVGVYYHPVDVTRMPIGESGYHSPFERGAFYDTDENGMPWPDNWYLASDDSIKIAWGNADQPAGFYPGRYSDGYPPTGLLVDEASWDFNTTPNPEFVLNPVSGQTQRVNSYTMYVMIYAEWTETVYFIGRFFRQEPGT
jgi:hypothetical protein